MATVLYTGQVAGQTMRVVDLGVGNTPRLVVESQQPPDAMGGHGWSMVDPISRLVFEQLLIGSGVVT